MKSLVQYRLKTRNKTLWPRLASESQALAALSHPPPRPAHTLHLSLLITHSLPAVLPPLLPLSTSFLSSLLLLLRLFLLLLGLPLWLLLMHSTPPLHSRWCFIHQSRRYSTHPLASYFLPRPSATTATPPSPPPTHGTSLEAKALPATLLPSFFSPSAGLVQHASVTNRTCEAGEAQRESVGEGGTSRWVRKGPSLALAWRR